MSEGTTRETKSRERFEELTPGLTHIRDGSRYVDGDTQLAWTLYVEGREDALEEAAQMFPEDKWEAVAKWIRSLSSKKDSQP